MRRRIAVVAGLGLVGAAVVLADAGQHGSGPIQFFNFGDAIGVQDGQFKITGIRSTVEVGHFESGSSDGEPVPVTSVAMGKDGKRLTDDGTGKPKAKDPNNESKPVIDESAKDAPLAKVKPNERDFSAMGANGTPGLARAEFDGDTVKSVTLAGSKTPIDFTGKGVTDQDIQDFLDGKKNKLVGNNGTVTRAMDASGKQVTCQG